MSDHSMLVEFTVYDASGFCRDLPDLLAHARAGIAAASQLPAAGIVDQATRPGKLAELEQMCVDLEDAYRRALEALEEKWKLERRARRRADREAVA